MFRLEQETHFDFLIRTQPGGYLNPTFSVELKPAIQSWLTERNCEFTIHRADQNMNYYLIMEIDLEIHDPDLAMLFKLTWL